MTSDYDLIREAIRSLAAGKLRYDASVRIENEGLAALARLEAEHTGQGTARQATSGGDRLDAVASDAAIEALRALYFTPGPPHLIQQVVRIVLGEYDSSWLEARDAEAIVRDAAIAEKLADDEIERARLR